VLLHCNLYKGQAEAKAAKFVEKENLRRAEVEILTLQQLSEQRASEVTPVFPIFFSAATAGMITRSDSSLYMC